MSITSWTFAGWNRQHSKWASSCKITWQGCAWDLTSFGSSLTLLFYSYNTMPSVFLLVFAGHGLLLLGCSILKSVSVNDTVVPVSLFKWVLYGPSAFLRVHDLYWAFPVRALAFLKPWDHIVGWICPPPLILCWFYLHSTASVVAALCSIPYPVLTVSLSAQSPLLSYCGQPCARLSSFTNCGQPLGSLLSVLPASIPAAYSTCRV